MKTDNLIRMESFDELLHALKVTHTMSIAQICNFLKVKRAWVSEYITSNVPHIMVQAVEPTGELYLHFRVRLLRSVRSYLCLLTLWQVCIPSSRNSMSRLRIFWLRNNTLRLHLERLRKICRCHVIFHLPLSRYLPDEIARLGSECVGVTSRSKVRHIEIEQPKEVFNRYKLVAIRALIGYAGIDEVIRRELFKTGHSRLELNIKGRSDKTSKLVFYVDYQNYIDAEVLSHKKSDLSEGKYLSEFKNFISKFTWTVPYETFEKGYRDKVDRLINH